jgi:uncharacterized protein YbjT (DUF2867 family)
VGTGCRVRALVRSTSDIASLPASVEVIRGDLEDVESLGAALDGVRLVYHLAHVRFTANLLQRVSADVEHVVIVSSLRALSRVPSATVGQVLEGESAAANSRVPWTILRPSMIFGDGDDRNISRLADRVRRRRWIPSVGSACRHQPVFVEDVLDAILAARATAARGQTYAIAGAEPLTWAELTAIVGRYVGERPRSLPLPAAAAARILSIIEATGLALPIRSEQVLRMLEDKVYDIEPARRDLGFTPLTFSVAMKTIYGVGQ